MSKYLHAQPMNRAKTTGYVSEPSVRLIHYVSVQRRLWQDRADARALLNIRCSPM